MNAPTEIARHQYHGEGYYNHAWSRMGGTDIKSDDMERIEATIQMIPPECNSILDVGCGDGRLTNRLASLGFSIAGLDISEEALRHIETETVIGSADDLQFPDKSFDLVLCAETLEHLPFRVYQRALSEITRVAYRYILITVPNSENREASLVSCPYCGCRFHPSWHMRSFNQSNMGDLFVGFHLQNTSLKGYTEGRNWPKFVVWLAGNFNVLPKPRFPVVGMCPQCGYTSKDGYSPTTIGITKNSRGITAMALPIIDSAFSLVESALHKKIFHKEGWHYLMALYSRNQPILSLSG